MSALRIRSGFYDLQVDVTEGDEGVALLVAKIDQAFRDAGGMWLEVGLIQQMGDSNADEVDDLVWFPAASTTVSVRVDADRLPDGLADLGLVCGRG